MDPVIISIIAIIISIIVAFLELVRDFKINKVNLESEYFKDIYKEHLIYKIPKARGYIKFDINDKMVGTDKLIDELQLLRQDSLYFQYNNHTFYRELKERTQKLEDFLVGKAETKFICEDQTQAYKEIQTELNGIYKLISDGYLGKKRYRKQK